MLNDLTALDVCLLAGTFALIWHNLRPRTTSLQTAVAPPPSQELSPTQLVDFTTRLATLETKVEGLPSLWATERARVEEQASLARRSAARIEQANRRAEEIRAASVDDEQPEFDIHPAVRASNGARGGEGVVHQLRPSMEALTGLAFTPPHKQR